MNVIIGTSRDQAMNPLSASGYFFDSGQVMGTQLSGSWGMRQRIFLHGNSYTTDEVSFVGPLCTDVQTCSQGVPPGVEIGLTFYQNKDAILIDSFDGTPGAAVSAKPDYKVKKFRYFYLFLFTFDFILDHSHTIQSACPNWSLFNRGFQSL